MVVFWISASVMVAVALAFLLPPLLSRRDRAGPSREAMNLALYRERRSDLEAAHAAGDLDAEQLATALRELDRELLRDATGDDGPGRAAAERSPYPAIIVAVALPLVAFGSYLQLGTPTALLEASSARSAGARDGAPPHSVEEMVARLEERMHENPEDPEGWLMLGRSYAAMNRLPEAREALEEANRRRPDHPFTLVALAEVMAGLQGNRLDGEPIALVRRALAIEPDFPRGLWLAGVHAFNQEDRERARSLWQRLVSVPGLSPDAVSRVNEAIAQAGGQPAPVPAAAGGNGARVTASVVLSPALASRLDGSETLFIFAKAAAGPPMPLAAVRRRASELPLTVTLDDSMAMTPQLTLSSFPEVVVSARISHSGGATPSPGDLQGHSEPLSPEGQPEVTVVIDEVVQ